ncbi:MAG: tetratricopeptide repeat protein [Sterolibacterium sp.]
MKVPQKQDVAFIAAVKKHRGGYLEEAAEAYRKILRLRPRHVDALVNLGLICRVKGDFSQAQTLYEQAVQVNPHAGVAWSNLASLLLAMGQRENARIAAQRATMETPGLAAAHDNLGFALFQLNRFDEAEQSLLLATKLDPNAANAWNNLGQVLQRQSRLVEAASAFQHAVKLAPASPTAFSNLLFTMHFGSQWTAEEIHTAHLKWGQQFESPLLSRSPMFSRKIENIAARPRVAFISPDLCNHPVAMFLRPLITHWPHDRFELGFYASIKKADKTTQWFKEQSDLWSDIYSLTDEAAASQIAQDRIDILIDLSGHTGFNRLMVLAYRPAPIQMSWLGYFDTTGMSAVDYVLADEVCVPPVLEHLFTEKVLRLPDGFVCYDPPANSPEPGPLPAFANGHITFGSQNQLAKITDEVIALWAELLASVPNSRLFFQAKAFNDARTVEHIAKAFEDYGIDRCRIDFLPARQPQEILANYRHIDIALDPFPCAGGTTTCEALWMGVPVVSLLGDRFGGRHSASHLTNVGLSNLVATDKTGYLFAARTLASDLSALAAIRKQLRQDMLASPLCDGKRFAENFAMLLAQTSTMRLGQ